MSNQLKGLQTLVVTCNGTSIRISSENLYVTSALIEPHQDNSTAEAWIGDEDVTLSNKNGAYCNENAPVSLKPSNADFMNLKYVYIGGTNAEKFVVSYWPRNIEGE